MNNIKKTQVLAISLLNEEHITLLIDGYTIECFVNSCPYSLKIGNTYDVELTINLLDSYEIERSAPTNIWLEKTIKGYGYILYGTLENDIFHTFMDFNDEDIHYEHPELNDQFIKLEANRIDVNFL